MKPGVIEVVLNNLRLKIQNKLSPPRIEASNAVDSVTCSRGSHREKSTTSSRSRKQGGGRSNPQAQSSIVSSRQPAIALRGQTTLALPSHLPPQQHLRSPQDDFRDRHDMEEQLMDYRETIEILEIKVAKLEQLVRLKDKRIDELKRR